MYREGGMSPLSKEHSPPPPSPPGFCKSDTKANYFSLKEFESLEAIGRDYGSFKYFSFFVQWSEFVN